MPKQSTSTKEKAPKRAAGKGNGKAVVNGNGRHLVIVESPAKARTVGRYLGNAYTVKASMGHVRDLPENKLGVDTEKSFSPDYQVMKGKKDVVADLKKAGIGVSSVYLATDPDREGEAISWHLREAAGWSKSIPIRRVVFHAITPEAIKEAFEHHRDIDMRLVNAQQARRILDRLVGYQLSPLLWKKVQRGLSAGRVQSVAVRLVVERDREIDGFVPVEYWSLEADLKPEDGNGFIAALHSLADDKKKIELPNGETVERIVADLERAKYAVATVNKREVKRRPTAPFITSTLQQEAWRQLRFPARKTMSVAQQLYEGIELGSEGSTGLITYMRTDSPQVTPGAVNDAREYIASRWGKEYVPPTARQYTSRSKVAQEAHEAIRPTGIRRDPESVRGFLSNDQYKLYDLVWKRMVASQMSDAVLDSTTVDVRADGRSGQGYVFRATGSVIRFPGFRVLYMEGKDAGTATAEDEDDGQERTLPALRQGQPLDCRGLKPEQHFTQPPPRYTEASLIKALEEKGIGRPSTYAPIISTIVDRQYVTRERGTLKSTRLGQVVSDQLTEHFPNIMDLDFTAQLEERLDDIANGKQEWVPILNDFYGPFTVALDRAQHEMERVRVEEPTDEVCEKCGHPMVVKHGRFGQFLACTGFPECRNTRPLAKPDQAGQATPNVPPAEQPSDEVCEKCGRPMVVKLGRFGQFLACTGFPECKNRRPILKKTGAHCPTCGGDLVERRGKGRVFYGCSNYPVCNFTVNRRPLAVPCPACDELLVALARDQAQCTNCAYKGPVPEEETAGAA